MEKRQQAHAHRANDIDAWLQAPERLAQPLYLLIDGAAEAAQGQPWRSFGGTPTLNLFEPRTANPEALAIAPRLLPLETAGLRTAAVWAFAQQGAEQPLATLIASPLAPLRLQDRLLRRFDIDAAGSDMLLRLWDPRVMLALVQAAPPWLDDALAFGTQALLPSRTGGIHSVPMICPEQDPLQGGRRLACSQPELDGLVDRSAADSLLAMLREHHPDMLDRVEDERRHAVASEQLVECLARGFSAPRDQALALGIAIEHGADWWHRSEWAACVYAGMQEGSLIAGYRKTVG